MRRDFARYPKYEQAYLRAFGRMLKAREGNGKPYVQWKCAEDVMRWWLGEGQAAPVNGAQMTFLDYEMEGQDDPAMRTGI